MTNKNVKKVVKAVKQFYKENKGTLKEIGKYADSFSKASEEYFGMPKKSLKDELKDYL